MLITCIKQKGWNYIGQHFNLSTHRTGKFSSKFLLILLLLNILWILINTLAKSIMLPPIGLKLLIFCCLEQNYLWRWATRAQNVSNKMF